MKRLILLFATVLCLSVFAQAQQPAQSQPQQPSQADDGDWNRLSWLTPETEVSVSGPHRFPFRCSNLQVTDEGLSCESHSLWISTRYLELSRSEVRSVSIRHDRRNFWIGVAAMSTLGFVAGATQRDLGPYNPPAANGLLVGALTGFATSPFVFAVVPLLPGHTLYKPGSSAMPPKRSSNSGKTHAFLARLRQAKIRRN